MTEPDGHVVGFIDLGTNSVHLMLVRIQPDQLYTVISLQRERVRLGEREFAAGRLLPAAMDRAALVCRSFVDLARSYGAQELIAAATSATREAGNRGAFLERLREEAGLEVHPISGLEEARLVYLGVLSHVEIGDRTALAIDIGGGSTEIAVSTVVVPGVCTPRSSSRDGPVAWCSIWRPPETATSRCGVSGSGKRLSRRLWGRVWWCAGGPSRRRRQSTTSGRLPRRPTGRPVSDARSARFWFHWDLHRRQATQRLSVRVPW